MGEEGLAKTGRQLLRTKLIREEVPVFVDTLVDETALRTTAWFDDLPVLTDDHVPYDQGTTGS